MTKKDYEAFKDLAESRKFTSPKWEEIPEKREFRDGYNSAIADLIKLTEKLVEELDQNKAHVLAKEIKEELKEYELCLETDEEYTLEDVFTMTIKCVDGSCSGYEARRLAQLIDELYK